MAITFAVTDLIAEPPRCTTRYTRTSCSTILMWILSGSSYADIKVMWPSSFFSVTLPAPPFSSVHSHTLMPKLGLPLYPTKLRAVIDFLELDQKIYSVSSKILIILPDFRSKIRELCIAGKELSISVQSQSEHSLIGKFYNSKDNEKGISSPDILVTDNVANYEASFEPDYVHAVLMMEKNIMQFRHYQSI